MRPPFGEPQLTGLLPPIPWSKHTSLCSPCTPAHPSPCRLWQLQNKMAAVGGEGTYEARLGRVVEAWAGIEQRLQVRVGRLEGNYYTVRQYAVTC